MSEITLQSLKEEAEEIQLYTQEQISEIREDVLERGNKLNSYLARSGKMLAEAKKLYGDRIKSDLLVHLQQQLSEFPSMTTKSINLIIESVASEEKYLVNLLDRINATITHQLDWMRSIISLSKKEEYHNKPFNH